ncbi:MAG TPA: hypothetical protein VF807_05570 [Ktedonobacterales bacterium]
MAQHEPTASAMELSPQIITIITTEHYNLQTGRAMTISESVGRSSLFVGAVSSGLVALAFVGQISRLGTAFFAFSLIVIPTLFFMGVVTFERVLQTGSQDILYARSINRLRHLYLEHAPQLAPYLQLPAHDDNLEVLRRERMNTTWWQVFLSMAGMIALINSALAGAFFASCSRSSRSLWPCAPPAEQSGSCSAWSSTSVSSGRRGTASHRACPHSFPRYQPPPRRVEPKRLPLPQ